MKKLEQLLNRLRNLWWKPRWKESDRIYFIYKWLISITEDINSPIYSINDLCSIDSGLWQFLCEKRLVKKLVSINFEDVVRKYYDIMKLEYRLMLSSIQEDKSQFLLDSIILPDEE